MYLYSLTVKSVLLKVSPLPSSKSSELKFPQSGSWCEASLTLAVTVLGVIVQAIIVKVVTEPRAS